MLSERTLKGIKSHVLKKTFELNNKSLCSLIKSAEGLKVGGRGSGSAHVHESKYFFAFARYDLSLFNLTRCL